jgi:hypothetical protein
MPRPYPPFVIVRETGAILLAFLAVIDEFILPFLGREQDPRPLGRKILALF